MMFPKVSKQKAIQEEEEEEEGRLQRGLACLCNTTRVQK